MFINNKILINIYDRFGLKDNRLGRKGNRYA